jgi:voltage-gated potassium channel Kch
VRCTFSYRPEVFFLSRRAFAPTPIFICGLPRSGTSFTRELLNSTRDVVIFDETPLARFSAMATLAREVRAVAGDPLEQWRGLAGREGARAAEVFAALCHAVSREQVRRRAGRTGLRRWGMKTPLAECSHQLWDEVFSPHAPEYVYCWRPPHLVYESLLSLPWGSHYLPEEFLGLLTDSLTHIRSLFRQPTSRVHVFDVHRASTRPPTRAATVRDLLAYLGSAYSWRVRRFVRRWPPVNRRSPRREPALPRTEIDRRLQAFSRLAEEDPHLEGLAAGLGLPLRG